MWETDLKLPRDVNLEGHQITLQLDKIAVQLLESSLALRLAHDADVSKHLPDTNGQYGIGPGGWHGGAVWMGSHVGVVWRGRMEGQSG